MKLFDPKLIKWIDNKNFDWKQVINQGVKLLVDNKKATWQLEDEILKITKKFGAYYVLEKGIALVHAPAGNYSFEAAASTILLKNNVCFNNQEDKCAKIIVTLASPDNHSHVELIQEFGNYFMNKDFKKKALESNSLETFLELIKKEDIQNEN
ncbi:PTS sugar transporter subunit IIA [Mycoplasmopsis cricetuli]|uniref:PTS sugar transporter subunit IIA n=1 Tax=Mycoplasmopsis cricetuli TaxID=171283 RepID=UPI00046F9F5A|nr:PTS sugar transporter subunit IIA [Mycoplasmopsis cricetuli]